MLALIKPAAKMSFISLWILLWLPAVFIAQKLGKKNHSDRYIQNIYKGILFIVGIRVRLVSEMASQRPLLLVSNHISYLDILIMGAHAPLRFTPKSDVRKWPFISGLCRLSGCIFIDRDPKKVGDSSQAISKALASGEAVLVFPEATTGDGLHMLPFKSGFFALAQQEIAGDKIAVQPIAVSYTHIWQLPIDRMQWPDIAWYGDMLLAPHLWNVLRMGGIDAQLTFLPVIDTAGKDRKQLAAECQSQIMGQVEQVRKQALPKTQGFSLPAISNWSKSKL